MAMPKGRQQEAPSATDVGPTDRSRANPKGNRNAVPGGRAGLCVPTG